MHPATCPLQDKAFFAILESHPKLDDRDNRGKIHSLPFVLMGVIMALLAGRDGNLSAIHRHMKNQFQALCLALSVEAKRVISRAQLPRLLARVDHTLLAQLIGQHYGLSLPEGFVDWLSGDGKELRGSIAKGQQRGEVCVSIMAQGPAGVVAQTHYNGCKESERPAILNLLTDNDLLKRKTVLDALHLTPELLKAIQEAKGTYLIGLKHNQPLLRRSCFIRTMVQSPGFQRLDAPLRKHGRQEERTYACFAIDTMSKAGRWQLVGMTTLVRVIRVRRTLAGVQTSRTTSYFISNQVVKTPQEANELYDAIRGHWQIETMHYRRDVVLAEDDFQSKFSSLQRTMSNLRTLAMSLLQSLRTKNMAAQLDTFADCVQELITFLKLKLVL